MGQRMKDEPHIYGDDCLLAFPEDKTPKYLYARFSKIVQCPDLPPGKAFIPPNDKTFKLTQDESVPCKWVYERSPWYVRLDVFSGPVRAVLYIRNMLSGTCFFSADEAGKLEEGTIYNSDCFMCTPLIWGTGGIATVTWTQEATDLLKAINLERADDLFMELRPLADGNKVYKFCKLKDATNIAIEFEPD